ncbi:hypothetical protein QF022_000877 [Vogesella perlucida]|nr:hypothetical protein [Vogesella perlucida]
MFIHGLPPAAHGLPCFSHGAVFARLPFFLLFLLKNKEIEKGSEEKEKTGHPRNRPQHAKCIHSFAQAKRGNRGQPDAFKALILLDFVEKSTK